MGAGDDRLRLSDGFDDGVELLAAADRMGLEGVVSKRCDYDATSESERSSGQCQQRQRSARPRELSALHIHCWRSSEVGAAPSAVKRSRACKWM
jgi:hypothetical protein